MPKSSYKFYSSLMDLYLLRHAHADNLPLPDSPYPDDRPLLDAGREKMRRAAEGLSRIIDSLDWVVSSPLTRARETAEIVVRVIQPKNELKIDEQFLPGCGASIKQIVKQQFKSAESLLIVGHEPDLSIALADCLKTSNIPWGFKKGGIAKLKLKEDVGILQWFIPNRVLRKFSAP